jgi:hypothetical protein
MSAISDSRIIVSVRPVASVRLSGELATQVVSESSKIADDAPARYVEQTNAVHGADGEPLAV